MTRGCFRSLLLKVCIAVASASAVAGGQGIAAANKPEPSRPLDDLLRVGARYQYDNVSDIDPWQDASLEYAQRLPFGTVVFGVNGAHHFDRNGAQFELQAYPRLTKRSYLFFDVAASSDKAVFLPLRLIAEPYYNFSNGWEVSAGAQYLQAPGRDVYTYSGTLARYFGNYWISARPTYTPVPDNDSYGGALTARRYFSDRYDYLSLIVSRSIGVDPSATDPTSFLRQPKLASYAVALDRRQPIGRTHARASYGFGYQSEEIAPGRNRLHRTAIVGLEWFIP